jgi:AraC family transcriptional regulator, positive regulator of tynA and feaB
MGAATTRLPTARSASGAALLRAQAYIVEHPANPQLNREMVSAAMRLSTRQLHRLFEANGTSIRRWILSQRLSECGRALKDPTLQGVSIAEICYRWGFSDTAHFSRAFRRAYGAAPRDYRERYRNGES